MQSFNRIDELAKQLQSLLPMKPEDQARLDKKIRLEFNYNSNHIEGNTLTYGETELLLIFDKTTGNHELREYEEMKSHDVAFEIIKEWAAEKERPLTEAALKELHKTLLVRPFWKEAITPDGQPTRRKIKVGAYKEYPNSVRLQNGEIFHYTSPQETPIKMGELIQWYKEEEEKRELHPVALAALLHYKFVVIHPFDDGNGRLSRLLMNYVLLRHELPPVIIKSAEKKQYLFALNQADTGNTGAFIDYIDQQVEWSLNISIAAAKGKDINEPGDLDKKIVLLKKKFGEEPNDSLRMVYSDEALNEVFENVITPILTSWENVMKTFDTLLMARNAALYVNDHFSSKGTQVDTVFKDLFKSNNGKLTTIGRGLENLKIMAAINGIRNVENNVGIAAGDIEFAFFQNAYEITYTNSMKTINKLYHQGLSDENIKKIAEDLGNYLYENIESYLTLHKGD